MAIAFTACIFWLPWFAAQYDLYRGRAALTRRDDGAALQWLGTAQKRDPANAEVPFLMARGARHQGRFDDMTRHLERAGALGFSVRRIERERRLALAQTARVDEVRGDLPQMLTAPGDDGAEICAAYVNGFCLVLDFEGAKALLDAWIADFPRDPEPHSRRGDLWFAQNEWNNAAPAYRQSLELDPSRTKTRLSLAQCLLNLNEPAAAEPEFRRCLKEAPENLEIWLGLGTCLMSLARPDEARTALAHVVERSSQHFDARRRLAELELEAERPEEALVWLRPLAKDWPEDSAVATLMAQSLQETGKAAEARPYWEAVRRGEESITRLEKLSKEVRERPRDVDLRYELGTMLIRYRSRELGVGWLKSLLQSNPEHRGAHCALADYYEKIGEAGQALPHRRVCDAAEVPHDP